MTTPNGLVVDAEYLEEIEGASGELRALILTKFCAPLMLSLAWHDAGTFDVKTKTGGPNGSIRNELNHAANRGLKIAVEYCEKIKAKHPKVTYADLYQLAGIAAIEVSRGPKIDFAPGRMDCPDSADEIRLPDPKQDLREIYYRMGLSDKDIVALSGAHTLGRTHIERSDSEGTCTLERVRLFNNSYFVELLNGEKSGFLQLPTDKVLVQDPVFRPYVELYAKDKEVFFKDYAASHKKLSELGFTPQLAVTPPESSPSGLKTAMTVTGNVFRLGRDILSYMYDVHKASKASKKAKSKTTNTSLDML